MTAVPEVCPGSGQLTPFMHEITPARCPVCGWHFPANQEPQTVVPRHEAAKPLLDAEGLDERWYREVYLPWAQAEIERQMSEGLPEGMRVTFDEVEP